MTDKPRHMSASIDGSLVRFRMTLLCQRELVCNLRDGEMFVDVLMSREDAVKVGHALAAAAVEGHAQELMAVAEAEGQTLQ